MSACLDLLVNWLIQLTISLDMEGADSKHSDVDDDMIGGTEIDDNEDHGKDEWVKKELVAKPYESEHVE